MNKIKQLMAILSFVPAMCAAQTTTENYVKTMTMLDASGTNSVKAVQYYNGLGYPTVSVATTGGNGETTYSLTTYDALGREACKYLPVADANKSLLYKLPDDIVKMSSTANNGDSTAYSQNHYDALDRITSVELPGQAWRDKDKRNVSEYSANTEADKVRIYKANPNGKFSLVNEYKNYPAGALTKEVSIDADNKEIITFKNLFGNIILQRTVLDGKTNLDTYYVYDAIGQLCYVLSPQYQTTGTKAINCYEYRYDYRGRIYKKILPGCKEIQYWYDNADRIICMQDGIMKTESKYRFYAYDKLGRMVVQGLVSRWNFNSTFFQNNSAIATFDGADNSFLGTGYQISSKFIEKQNSSDVVLEIVNYYDGNQALIKNKEFAKNFNDLLINTDVCQIGQLTGNVTLAGSKEAGNTEYLAQVMVYDLKGNLVNSKSREFGGRIASNTNTYSFTNNVESSTTTIKVGTEEYTINNAISYNKYNNLKSQDALTIVKGSSKDIETIKNQSIAAINGKDKIRSTISYNYDKLGRLSSISRPRSGQSYSYDMRGWLTMIGNVNFEEHLSYDFNGNIKNMEWKHNDPVFNQTSPRRYEFTYDGANRLTNSVYREYESRSGNYINNDNYNESVTYDSNGNIKTLQRRGKMQNGSYGLIDNLTLYYTGNQLSSVMESAKEVNNTNSFDYKGDKGSKYVYNENGSLIADKSRGIAYIKYDFNNNPQKIYFVNGSETEYVYSASGQKLRVKHITAKPNVMTRVVGEKPSKDLPSNYTYYTTITDYLLGGSLIVKGNTPDMYVFGEGYCTFNQQSNPRTNEYWTDLSFYYYDKDHLGNIREVVDASGNVKQITQYYPFGATYADASATKNPDLQQYKYNGKELDRMHGLNTYDYGARQHDPILGRWDRIDPLCEKYYSISPYAYCANNPVKFIDPDGRKIDTSQMSDEELNSYNQFINGICSYEMMQTVYEALQNSDATFQVSFDKRTGSTGDFVDGQFVVGADDKGGNIYLDRDKGMNGTLSGLAIMEEFFHAYQNDNSANYTGEFNREFEAKTFCIAATGQTADLYQGMQAWSEGIALGKYSGQFEYISPAAASSPKFLEEYQSSANQYASFNKQHNIGNINYHQATTCKPQNLINVINLTYNK